MDRKINKQEMLEIQKQARADVKQMLQRAPLMEALLKSPAWIELSVILDANVQQRVSLVAGPPTSAGRDMENYMKGVIYGIRLTQTIPQAIINESKEIKAEEEVKQPQGEQTDE